MSDYNDKHTLESIHNEYTKDLDTLRSKKNSIVNKILAKINLRNIKKIKDKLNIS